jgi:hypothetical protein
MRRARAVAGVLLVLLAGLLLGPDSSAAAFGTINSGDQNREHERITRAALACPTGSRSDGFCFEAASADLLTGHDREFGAVGAPDSDELSDPAAHCDNADFLAGPYPQTRQQATDALTACVDHLRSRYRQAVDSAVDLLTTTGRIDRPAVTVESGCRFSEAAERRAKCNVIEGLGRLLHGAQDFYAHSNWADEADPSRPIDAENPPGLNRPGPSTVLDLAGSTTPEIPQDLTTGCFVLKDQVVGVAECTDRVTHAALNKDNGLIDPSTAATSDPTTPRGMVGDNFAKAVAGAVAETRRQWRDLRAGLVSRYGEESAAVMVCALTRDDSVADCQDRDALVEQLRADRGENESADGQRAIVILLLVSALVGASVLVIRWQRVRRRRQRSPDGQR